MKHLDELTQLAATISEALAREEIEAVLSGGAAVQIYSDGIYVSKDLDFVTAASNKEIGTVLGRLGFEATTSRRLYQREGTEYLVEFPSAPLALGRELVREWHQLRTAYGTIQILSPTQSVKDRLAAYIHWRDLQALRQAGEIALRHAVDLADIFSWLKGEGAAKRDIEAVRKVLAPEPAS